ncbi:hypothetical protein ACLESO_42265, partial [Pyxidicoccus sp. 3LG]
MRLRWVFWGVLLALHLFAVVSPPEVVAPAVGGSVYLPLMVLDALGLPVYQGGRGEAGGLRRRCSGGPRW